MWVQKLNDNQGIKKDAVVWYIVEDILCGNNKLSLPWSFALEEWWPDVDSLLYTTMWRLKTTRTFGFHLKNISLFVLETKQLILNLI